MSTRERQRRFQARHPGYDRRRKARQRPSQAQTLAYLAALLAQAEAQHAQDAQVLRIPIPTTLALPAPVEALVLPAINNQPLRLPVRA